ncbi:MAG TPA: hypothetical protein VNT26_07315 [Candidatus Sulfotelmatobacter sp.]|nr:hypothetical protein [Candidatus Sulfotelmatobacter sp.]HWI57911.1 hypothetical protein [Bacillota bacterium]
MTDFFALLQEPRRPWLDPEALKQKFLRLSAAVHPDRVHSASDAERHAAQQRYANLNTAYQCLREPKTRLQHLLELERGAKPQQVQQIPPELMPFFMEAGRLFRDVDAFLAEKAKVTSPLLKVELFQRGQAWVDRLSALQNQLRGQDEALLTELQNLNAFWDGRSPPAPPERAALLPQVEALWRLLSYFARWQSQIQERILLLTV